MSYTALPTHQRRLRHLVGIACRNIVLEWPDGKRRLPDLHFTLHQWDDEDPPFYTSEIARSSLNPSWRPFNLLTLPGLNSAATSFIIRIWKADDRGSELVIEWKVDLRGLSYLAPELELDRVHPPDTLLFELTDGYYHFVPETPETDEVRSNMVKVDKARQKKSSTQAQLEQITRTQLLKETTEQEVEAVKRKIQHKLDLEGIILKKYEQKRALLARQSFIRDEINRNREALGKERQQEEVKRIQLRARREKLQDSMNKLEIGKAFLELNTLNMEENREKLKTTVTLLVERRWELLSQLQKVFAVKPVDEKTQLYKVCDIPLPNTEYTGFDDEQIASALGYISQAVLAISNYFEIPLRYSLNPAGSRSVIRDDISYAQGATTQEFPLYTRGVERFRFDYAVFLLNKDIEQLLNARGHGVSELRNTLPNIYTLLEHETILRTKKHEKWAKQEDFGRESNSTPHPG